MSQSSSWRVERPEPGRMAARSLGVRALPTPPQCIFPFVSWCLSDLMTIRHCVYDYAYTQWPILHKYSIHAAAGTPPMCHCHMRNSDPNLTRARGVIANQKQRSESMGLLGEPSAGTREQHVPVHVQRVAAHVRPAQVLDTCLAAGTSGMCAVSTRILGRRTAPFSTFPYS